MTDPNIYRYRKIIWDLKKNWKIRYDDTWREVIKEVSKELDMPVEDVERICTAWWKFVGEMMSRVDMPKIRMQYLMTIYPSTKKLYTYCDNMSEMVERIIDGDALARKIGDVNAMKKHLVKLHDTYFRLLEEGKKKVRKGISVSVGWKNRPVEKARELRRIRDAGAMDAKSL